MIRSSPTAILLLASFCVLAAKAGAQQPICYEDDQGRRVCSDRYVPEASRFDREIRNEQGVVIRTEQGEITAEERAAMEAEERAQAEAEREAEEARRYGQMLLDAYPDVVSIESQRDRILDQIEGQITVIELYLSNLQRKLGDLEQQAERFAPRSEHEGAPAMPDNLSLDLERTRSSIALFRQRLEQSLQNREDTQKEFQRRIETFRRLKGHDA